MESHLQEPPSHNTRFNLPPVQVRGVIVRLHSTRGSIGFDVGLSLPSVTGPKACLAASVQAPGQESEVTLPRELDAYVASAPSIIPDFFFFFLFFFSQSPRITGPLLLLLTR